MSDPNELISIYQAESGTEAHLVKNLLLDADIHAAVAEEHSLVGIEPSEVFVRRADEARARVIVEQFDDEQVRRADRPDWTCPACQATVVGAFDECDACGASRPGTEEANDDEDAEDMSE